MHLQKRLPLIFIASLIIVITATALMIYSSSRKTDLAIPNFNQSPSQELAKALAQKSLNLESTPLLHGDRIEASISGVLVYFSTKREIKMQVRALQLVLPRLKMGGRSPKVIDVRFEKVVIRY